MTSRLATPLALLVAALLAHLAWSPLGFNPTDEGFVLAQSRRVLDGQVPHRDWITVRPALSAYLHVPEVMLGGERTIWWSRGVAWLEMGAIVWCWFLVLGRAGLPLKGITGASLALVALALSVNTFPMMAWHTIDGLLLASAGVALLAASGHRSTRPSPPALAGCVLLGAAALCRQNLALVAPAAIILLGQWRNWRCWAAAAAPTVVYACLVALAGGWTDMVTQLTAVTEMRWGHWEWAWPFILGGAICVMALQNSDARVYTLARIAVVFTTAWFFYSLAGGRFWETPSWQALGWGLGAALALVVRHPREAGNVLLLVAVVAWASSVSVGYNSPALMAGPLALGPLGALKWT